SQIEGKWTEKWIEQTKGWIKTLERKLKEEYIGEAMEKDNNRQGSKREKHPKHTWVTDNKTGA
ncbi:17340_t:CDS:2, partial [Gigaspora rosea]